MYDMEGFAKRIQDLRKSKGLTQEDLAERLGITSQAVSKWETKLSYPDVTMFPAITAIFNITMDEMFGKIPEEGEKTFPQTYQNLPLIHVYRNAACYSEKKTISAEDSLVKFEDGSTADLINRIIVNTGKGEISIMAEEQSHNSHETGEPARYEFPFAHSVDLEVVSGICDIVRAEDDKTKVVVSGSKKFIVHHRLSVIDGQLAIRCDNPEDLREQDYQNNKIHIALPCETGKRMRLLLNNRGSFSVPIPFETGDAAINGSGNIDIHSAEQCKARINGSGNLTMKNAKEASLDINGSGDMKLQNTETLSIRINGSGDVEAGRAKSLNANINGSGDIRVDEMTGGSAAIRINGSGDTSIKSGECDTFDIKIAGSGNVDATGLTAQKAIIVLEHTGEVVLGRVLGSSQEQIKRRGTIRILQRH